MSENTSVPALVDFYQRYLIDQEATRFINTVSQRYTAGTLERLATASVRETRCAAITALGFVGSYESNAVLGRALTDQDREVRMLASSGIRSLWSRQGSDEQRRQLNRVMRANESQQFTQAARAATALIDEAPNLSEAWNQRAIANYCLAKYFESISDCRMTLDLNPYHFGAAGGMAQCHVQLGNLQEALKSFRQALAINPDLEGVRANVTYLERSLNQR